MQTGKHGCVGRGRDTLWHWITHSGGLSLISLLASWRGIPVSTTGLGVQRERDTALETDLEIAWLVLLLCKLLDLWVQFLVFHPNLSTQT